MSWNGGWPLVVCALVAVGGHFAVSSRPGGGVRRPARVPALCKDSNRGNSARASRDDIGFSRNRTRCCSDMPLGQRRTPSRRFARGGPSHAVTSVNAGGIPWKASDVIVAPGESPALAFLLGAETTRGPPGGAVQCPRLSKGARDRPAPLLCATPPLSDFHLLPALRRRLAQLLSLLIGCRAAHGVTRADACPRGRTHARRPPNQLQPNRFTPKGAHESRAFLPRQPNNTNENDYEYESHPSFA